MLLLRMLFLVVLCVVSVWLYYEWTSCDTTEKECIALTQQVNTKSILIKSVKKERDELSAEAERLNRRRVELSGRISALLKRSIALQKEWSNIKVELARYRLLKERIDSVVRQANILLDSLRPRTD